jgi:hypothetical protein
LRIWDDFIPDLAKFYSRSRILLNSTRKKGKFLKLLPELF